MTSRLLLEQLLFVYLSLFFFYQLAAISCPPAQPSRISMIAGCLFPLLIAVSRAVVVLEIYGESQCPDTTRFFVQQLWPIWQNMSTQFQLSFIPFGKANCTSNGTDDFTCECQHGPTECDLNQMQNCVIEQFPKVEDYLPFLYCIQGMATLNNALSKCLENQARIDVNRTMTCSRGIRGRQLLAAAGNRTKALDPALDFVPWIMIDGVRVEDALYNLLPNMCKNDPSLCSAANGSTLSTVASVPSVSTPSVSTPSAGALYNLSYISMIIVCVRLIFISL